MNTLENNVSNRTFEELFTTDVQFEIPFFQRGYVWGKTHWDQLFSDINEQILPELEDLDESELRDDRVKDAEHFFGPIVVLQKKNTQFGLQNFLVIDGQQRITTIYLLLATIKNKIAEKAHESEKASEYCNALEQCVVNKLIVDNDDDYALLKVLSTKGDRLPTYHLVFGNKNPRTPQLLVDQQMYNPAKNNIDAFCKYLDRKLKKECKDTPSLWRLAQILLKSLKIVWIGLDESKDDPQAIFESLNDRGIPLSASELLCNYLFKPLIAEKSVDYERLHNEYWLHSIARIEAGGDFGDYLRLRFSIGEKKVLGKGRRIYVHFKTQNKKLTAEKAKNYLAEIKSGVGVYNQITNPERNRNENADNITDWLIKIKSTRMFSCNPFLLALLTAHADGKLDGAVASSLLQETLVLLVRRKMCELSTTKYDSIFPNMLSRIVNEPCPAKAFKEEVLKEGYFVSNQEFETGLLEKPLYRPRELSFTRLVLREIDKSMQVYDQLPDYSTLGTIEHVLPQTLTDDWKAYLGADCQNTDLNLYTHTLGNLCLLSRPANSHAGQDPFALKKADYTNVSALTADVKKRDGKWGIAAIKNRGKDLSKKALEIWAWSE